MKKTEFTIKGMHCKSCSMLIKDTLMDTKGVKDADVNLQKGNARISFDEQMLNEKQLCDIIKKAGYDTRLK